MFVTGECTVCGAVPGTDHAEWCGHNGTVPNRKGKTRS